MREMPHGALALALCSDNIRDGRRGLDDLRPSRRKGDIRLHRFAVGLIRFGHTVPTARA